MFTQCPECHTAFRVTARVLQQAAGRVRCGGCGKAFSALDYLSEELPTQPDVAADPAVEARSRKLLETLDELTGPENVVIEDTGVEWQVLDEDAGDGDATGQHDISDTGSLRWMLEDVDDAEPLPEIVDEVSLAKETGNKKSDPESVMRFDDNTPLPDDFDDVVTVSHASPQRRQDDRIQRESQHFDEMQIDLALGSPDEWVELLDEVDDESPGDERGIPMEVEEELAAIHSELTSGSTRNGAGPDSLDAGIEPDDVESQFDSQAEALGLDVTGSRERPVVAAAPDESDEETRESPQPVHEDFDQVSPETHRRSLESTGEFEEQIEAARVALLGEDDAISADEEVETGEYPLALEADAADEEPDDAEFLEDDDDVAEKILRGELQAANVPAEDEERVDAEIESVSEPEPDTESVAKPPAKHPRYPDHLFDENAENVETIIMEGEFVHGSLRDELLEARNKAENMDEAAFLADTYSLSRKKIRGGRRRTDPPGLGTIAGILVLALLLAAQLMHHHRQFLSTFGAFNQTVAPVYRMMGSPIVPEWDIKGWQFQKTEGATNEEGQLLTILSTIVNRSSQALPYPLVHVSLTDRWEEIIGSRVLEPNEYLAGDLDPSTPVAAGDRFTAVISITSPAPEATGFKLNVCYRVGPGRVRCATEDFKD